MKQCANSLNKNSLDGKEVMGQKGIMGDFLIFCMKKFKIEFLFYLFPKIEEFFGEGKRFVPQFPPWLHA